MVVASSTHLGHRLHEAAGDRVAVPGDRADDAAAGTLCALQLGQQQLHQEEVAQMLRAANQGAA